MFAHFDDYIDFTATVVAQMAAASKTLRRTCFFAGSTPVACESFRHTVSMDTDWFTKDELGNPGAAVKELKAKFGNQFKVYEREDEYGIFRATLKLFNQPEIGVDILSSLDAPRKGDLRQSVLYPEVHTITSERYLRDKIQCLEDRHETKDLLHLCAIAQHPGWEAKVDRALQEVDPDILERNLHLAAKYWPKEQKAFVALPGMNFPSSQEFVTWMNRVEEKHCGKLTEHNHVALENQPLIMPGEFALAGPEDSRSGLGKLGR